MGILIDIIVIVFILLCVFWGYKKGLVKLGIRLVSFLIAILITFILYRPIADLIINYTSIDETIQDIIINRIDKEVEDKVENENDLMEKTADTVLKETARYSII